jgi:hypothetical protein
MDNTCSQMTACFPVHLSSSLKKEQARTQAQVTISTTWKKHKNLKIYRESLKEWDASITQPVITEKPSTPNRNDVLSEIPESIRKYYHIVSHDTFLYHLNKSLNKALEAIKDEPYRLLNVSPSNNIRSEHWVAGLLLRHNPTFQPLPPPKREYYEEDKSFYNLDFLNVSPEPKHYVVVDDAAYTGMQMSQNISDFISDIPQELKESSNGLNIHVVIPFVSHNAKQEIEAINAESSRGTIKVSLYASAQIMHIDEQKLLMTDVEKKLCKELEYMTIFSHKQADDISLGKAAKEFRGSTALYSKPETRQTFIEYLEEQKNKKQS